MSTLPKYIARGGEVAWIGLSGYRDVELYGFAIKADPTLVHEMWSRYVGEPSQELGAHIDVRGTTLDHVLFVFVDSEQHQESRNPGSKGLYREQLFAVVVLGYRRRPDPGLVLFAPYLCASDTPGWKADREIYGYPRVQGSVRIDRDRTRTPQMWSVEGSVIRHFHPKAKSELAQIFRIVRSPDAVPERPTGSKRDIARTIATALGATRVEPRGHRAASILRQPRLGVTEADLAFFERFSGESAQNPPDDGPAGAFSLEQALLSGALPMLFLKQFRDVAYADRACYQAIVEAPLAVSGDIVELTGQGYRLELDDFDSAPIRRELGIPPGNIDVSFAFRLEKGEISVGEAKVISNPDWNPAIEVSTTDDPSRLPLFVDRGGEAVWRQPSLIFGARIHGFGVPVPLQQQQATLTRCINEVAAASKSTYGSQPFCLRPCSGVEMVMLLFVEYDRITSGNADDRGLGGTAYREFLAMQLAISDDPEYPELDWFIPYICLDTDAPRLGGREIFGYPKQLGTIDPFELYARGGPQIDIAKTLELRTTAILDAAKDLAARDTTVVTVKGPQVAPRVRAYSNPLEMLLDLWRSAGLPIGGDSLFGHLFPHLPPGMGAGGVVPGGSGVDVISAMLSNRIGDVFLKEFRDCLNPDDACYQAVCKTDMTPTKFHYGGFLEDPSVYDITIQNLASEPLLDAVLGEGSGVKKKYIKPVFAYSVYMDLELTSGRVIANPLAAPDAHAPDVSLNRNGRRRRPWRVTPFAEPLWAR